MSDTYKQTQYANTSYGGYGGYELIPPMPPAVQKKISHDILKRILLATLICSLIVTGIGASFVSYHVGYQDSKDNFYSIGHHDGYTSGRQEGYNSGYAKGKS